MLTRLLPLGYRRKHRMVIRERQSHGEAKKNQPEMFDDDNNSGGSGSGNRQGYCKFRDLGEQLETRMGEVSRTCVFQRPTHRSHRTSFEHRGSGAFFRRHAFEDIKNSMFVGCLQGKPGSADLIDQWVCMVYLSDRFAFILIETWRYSDLSHERHVIIVRLIEGMLRLIMALSVRHIVKQKRAW